MAEKVKLNGRLVTAVINEAFNRMAGNAYSSRFYRMMQSMEMDDRRSYAKEFGYPATDAVPIEKYQELYDRDPIAARVVEVWPSECWQASPILYEDEDQTVTTPFEARWDELNKQLLAQEGESYYQDEKGNMLWSYLYRLDVLQGIGFYGVLLLGADDGRELIEPLEPRDGQKLLYLRVFPQTLADIASCEQDRSNPRFGMPNYYNITFNDPDNTSTVGVPNTTLRVHHSRVLHVSDGVNSSEVLGVPRIRPVLNRLIDLQKLYGGSAEMYWQGAKPPISIETHPHLEDVEMDIDTVREQIEQLMNGMQRWMALSGASAKSLAPQVVDPSPQIDKQLEAICVKLSIPKRVFLGSERGELSSAQDRDTWNGRIQHRNSTYTTPRLIVPFISKLVHYGFLPAPTGFSVRWPDLDAMTSEEAAAVDERKTNAMSKYVAGGADSLMAPHDFLVRVLGFTAVEAEEIVQGAAEHIEEVMDEREQMVKLGMIEDEEPVEGEDDADTDEG